MNKESILFRLEEMIQVGEAVSGTRRPPPPHVSASDSVDSEKFGKWRVSSMVLLKTAFTESSTYFVEFAKHCRIANHSDAVGGLVVLRAVKSDILAGVGVDNIHTIDIEGLPLHPRIAEVCVELYRDRHFSSAVLVLQRRFKEGCGGRHEVRRGAWHGSAWPARYYPASLPATAATQPARTVPWATIPAPPGRPAAS